MRPKLDSGENLLRDAMRVAIPVEDPEKVAARREELLKVIGYQVALSPSRVRKSEARRKWTQGLRLSVAAAALALAAGVGMFVQSQHRDVASVSETVATGDKASDAEHAKAKNHARVAHQGESLATSVGEKQRLRLPGDTVVSVGERTGLRLIEAIPQRQVLELDYGRVDVDVTPAAKGADARYVSVRTPHAVVEVKGTIFAVEVYPSADEALTAGARPLLTRPLSTRPLSTTVSVQRGVVVVHSATGDLTLREGESWTSAERLAGADLEDRASRTNSSASSSSSAIRRGETSPSSGALQLPPEAPSALPSSTLAEENELFERVIVAAESGNKRQALSLCDEFLERYPRSPLRVTVFAKRNQLEQ